MACEREDLLSFISLPSLAYLNCFKPIHRSTFPPPTALPEKTFTRYFTAPFSILPEDFHTALHSCWVTFKHFHPDHSLSHSRLGRDSLLNPQAYKPPNFPHLPSFFLQHPTSPSSIIIHHLRSSSSRFLSIPASTPAQSAHCIRKAVSKLVSSLSHLPSCHRLLLPSLLPLSQESLTCLQTRQIFPLAYLLHLLTILCSVLIIFVIRCPLHYQSVMADTASWVRRLSLRSIPMRFWSGLRSLSISTM